METTVWVKVLAKRTPKGIALSGVDLYKKKVEPTNGSVVLQLSLTVPDSLFYKPTITASVVVPEGKGAPVIDSDVVGVVQDALVEQLGMMVEVSVKK